jgi:hypothetical protein
MEAGATPPAPRQTSRRGLVWGPIVVVVVLAVVGVAAVLFLWPSEDERITVPDVVGLSTGSAERVLEAAGLALGDVEYVSVDAESADADTVLSQAPSAGSEADAGSEVAVVVGEAPEETSEEDEAEPPSAGSGGGSGSSGGSGASGSSGTGAQPTWHTVDSDSGTSSRTSSGFTTTSTTPLELSVTASSSPAAGVMRFVLYDKNSGSPTGLDVTVNGTTTSVTQVFEPVSVPAGEYQMRVFCSSVMGPGMTLNWSYTLREWR